MPSKPIREQTLRALRDRQHPYQVALREAGPVTAIDLEEAKSATKGIEKIDAAYRLGGADPACPVKFILTQKALAEGWDCPFAYILFSMASLHSATAVEQFLGRVLRQPGASHRSSRLLSQSYAFVVARNFAETANALRERLVTGAGFERREVSEFVTAATSEQARLDLDGHAGRGFVRPVSIALPEKPDLKGLPKAIRNQLRWDTRLNTLTVSAPLTEDEGEALTVSVTSYAAAPGLDDVNALSGGLKASEGGEIDIDIGSGRVVSRFLLELQCDLGLAYQPEHWSELRLATWLCRNLPDASLTHASKQAFVASLP